MKRKTVLALTATAAWLSLVFLPGCSPPAPPDEPARLVTIAADHDFIEQPTGLHALEELYGFQFDRAYAMAVGLTHEALRAGDVDIAKGYATDGKIKELDLVSLEDDLAFFPALNPALVIHEDILDLYPEIRPLLEEVAPRLEPRVMIQLNYQAHIEDLEPREVVYDWLLAEGLIPEEPPPPGEGEPVVVGSKDYMEQRVLGQIPLLLLESAGIPVQDSTDFGPTDLIRTALLTGNIHMYWEYTGTAWNHIFGEEEVLTDPDRVYRLVSERDAEEGLVWLDYAPVNNTCAILMRREHAGELGISTISQLARWVKEVQGDG